MAKAKVKAVKRDVTVEDVAATMPSKRFIVDMLTRDISLNDTILDLIDNCLDGVKRMGKENALSEFFVEIEFDGKSFKITDNCGGIPLDIAKESAFASGAPDHNSNKKPGMVGVYGIGMKRAIFKLGRDAVVTSRSFETYKMKKRCDFQVEINETWLDSKDWKPLDIKKIAVKGGTGTTIVVKKLNQSTSSILSTKSAVSKLRKKVSRQFALFLDRGFNISIIGPGYDKKDGSLNSAGEFFELSKSKDIQPFIAAGEVDGVKFEIYAGFISDPARGKDEAPSSQSEDDKVRSGWTIACNDRIVLWRDRTHLTSWGANSVGMHHSQYNSIAGLVLLSGDPELMPLTTTKSGVDMSHPLYHKLIQAMAAATRQLTSITSKVKKDRDGYSDEYSKTQTQSVSQLRVISKSLVSKKSTANKLRGLPEAHVQEISFPTLVIPPKAKLKKISYSVDPKDFTTVSEYLEIKSAPKVGKATFELILEDAQADE